MGGSVEQRSFTSELSGEDINFQVYLPPCYGLDPEQNYPVIYLLHGLLFNNDQWLRLGLVALMDELIASHEIAPALVVLPQESLLLDTQHSSFSEVIVSELVPWIDDNYYTHPERSFRAIGGISRGAGWAVQIGFDNPHLFSRIGAHSLPLFETDTAKITGWLAQIPKEDYPEVFIDIGRDDPEWQTAQAFADQLDKFQVPHQWYLFTDGHTETYWTNHLELYLRWYLQDW
jgi:enterochelin esterase-like enzyme